MWMWAVKCRLPSCFPTVHADNEIIGRTSKAQAGTTVIMPTKVATGTSLSKAVNFAKLPEAKQ
jgi:hypothetical protein